MAIPHRVMVFPDGLVRVTYDPSGAFAGSCLNRCGFLDEDEPEAVIEGDGDCAGVECRGDSLSICREDGFRVVRQENVAIDGVCAKAAFKMLGNEDWVGFGDQSRERTYHKGHCACCEVHLHRHKKKVYCAHPWFMSVRGYGILVNTTYTTTFDMCCSDPERFGWTNRSGVVDYYVVIGDTYKDMVSRLTRLTGRPKLPPLWSFGLFFLCRHTANDFEVAQTAYALRREELPCDVLGLEWGWVKDEHGACARGVKEWREDRFAIPEYAMEGPSNLLNALERMGFHVCMWTSSDYDFTPYEEARLAGQLSPEGWADHLMPFVDQGASMFKDDAELMVWPRPKKTWANGRHDEEMHNLMPLLQARQEHDAIERHIGKRSVGLRALDWIGGQRYPGLFAGDVGGDTKSMRALLNVAFSGHSVCCNDMAVMDPVAIHLGYLLPWAQINSWNYFRMPWLQGDELFAMHRLYGDLRSRLVPYLYSWAYHAYATGVPMLRPMQMEFQQEFAGRELGRQYMLGRDLMVCAPGIVRLPAGPWRCLFTGRELPKGRQVVEATKGTGGGLFVREGGIVPLGPVRQYQTQRPLDEIELLLFPSTEETSFELYEDDGESVAHRKGEYAITTITMRREGRRVSLSLERRGPYPEVQNRRWSFAVWCPVDGVTVNGGSQCASWALNRERATVDIRDLSGVRTLDILM